MDDFLEGCEVRWRESLVKLAVIEPTIECINIPHQKKYKIKSEKRIIKMSYVSKFKKNTRVLLLVKAVCIAPQQFKTTN